MLRKKKKKNNMKKKILVINLKIRDKLHQGLYSSQSVSEGSIIKPDVPLIHAPVQELTSTHPRLVATQDICP